MLYFRQCFFSFLFTLAAESQLAFVTKWLREKVRMLAPLQFEKKLRKQWREKGIRLYSVELFTSLATCSCVQVCVHTRTNMHLLSACGNMFKDWAHTSVHAMGFMVRSQLQENTSDHHIHIHTRCAPGQPFRKIEQDELWAMGSFHAK